LLLLYESQRIGTEVPLKRVAERATEWEHLTGTHVNARSSVRLLSSGTISRRTTDVSSNVKSTVVRRARNWPFCILHLDVN
jgi:hypothetical protein